MEELLQSRPARGEDLAAGVPLIQNEAAAKAAADDIARQNEVWLQQHLTSDAEFVKSGQQVCVIFADLVGSTAFKCRHKPIEGLEKVYTHNRCAAEVIESRDFQGEVAKFLGDGVLAFFEGPDAAKRGLGAALEIVKRIHAENDRRMWGFPKAMFTRVGVDYGPVWMMHFKTALVRDPQGTTVDTAARLASLSESDQVLATHAAFEQAGGPSEFPNHRYAETCTVRGLLTPIRLVSVASPDGQPRPVILPGGFPPSDRRICGLLKSAAEHWQKSETAAEGGDHPKAADELTASMKDYEDVLKDDVLNFDANYNLAVHLIANIRNHKETRAARLERAVGLLRIAASERPGSCYAWKWLSWARFRQFREGCLPALDHLNEAIEYATHALRIAESHHDEYGAAISKIFIIIYITIRLPLVAEHDRARDIQMAQNYTEQVRTKLDAGLGRWLKSRFVSGEALTGLATGKYDESKARELLDEAARLDPQNLLAVELVADLLQGGLLVGAAPRRATVV
jgi:class 3 adenylate cyclase